MTNSNEFQFFWYEGPLSWVEEFCLRSFTRFPEVTVHLYTYDRNLDPHLRGCVCHDASEFLPRDIADRWKMSIGQAGFSPVSCLFRYRLLYEKGGWYFDTDCILVKPLTPLFQLDYVFAWESATTVNNGVIKFPKHEAMLEHLYDECVQVNPESWTPGSFVPPFTKYLKKFDLITKALPPDYFYPIRWDYSVKSQQIIPGESPFIVHLYTKLNRDLFYRNKISSLENKISSLENEIDTLNNSISVRFARSIPFGKTLRRILTNN